MGVVGARTYHASGFGPYHPVDGRRATILSPIGHSRRVRVQAIATCSQKSALIGNWRRPSCSRASVSRRHEELEMWDNLLRVNWGRLRHAYGWAHDVPDILRNMIVHDESARAAGWDDFLGIVNHQDGFFDSTVAAVPFLIEAVAQPDTPQRAQILYYLRDRSLDAPFYGGDPHVLEPPGG